MQRGLVHIYCGDGKGKTTAAVGLATRAAGDGKKVLFVQFMKASPTGEIATFEKLPNVTVMRGAVSKKFSWEMDEEELAAACKANNELLAQATAVAREDNYDFLILDEALGTCSAKLLDEQELLATIHDKPQTLELVLTGRNPSEALVAAADYVSEIRKIKHPYDKGIKARKAVEY